MKEHCYSKGNYCATSELILESKSLLDEAIRQKCIWRISQNEPKQKYLWWNYIGNYRNCLKDLLKNNNPKKNNCFEQLMNLPSYKVETKEAIEDCYIKSFDNPNNKFKSKNTILKEDDNSYEYSGVYLVPAMFINKYLVKEDLKTNIVISAMCDKLIDKPDICKDYIFDNINWNYTHQNNKSHRIFAIILFIIIGACVILFMVLYVKKRMNMTINEEINQDIKNHVSEYMKLRDAT